MLQSTAGLAREKVMSPRDILWVDTRWVAQAQPTPSPGSLSKQGSHYAKALPTIQVPLASQARS